MVNKKGYLRIIESIIAIVVILIIIVGFLPREEIQTPKTPPELDLSSKAILKELENNDLYREHLLTINTPNPAGLDSLQALVEFIDTTLPPLSPMSYALSICETEQQNICTYYTKYEDRGPLNREDFNKEGLPTDTNIFIRTISIGGEDVNAPPLEPPTGEPPSAAKTIKLFFWLKQ